MASYSVNTFLFIFFMLTEAGIHRANDTGIFTQAKNHSIATQRYLPYAIWHKIWQGYGIRHSITISLYNDITIERCIQKAGMMRENAQSKIDIRHD